MPEGPGRALDFGAGEGFLSLVAASRSFRVMALDLEFRPWLFAHPEVTARVGDVLGVELPSGSFDLVINCSTVEHVGLAGRYGNEDASPDGDLDAMRRLRNWLRPTGVMLMSVPVGRDAVFEPNCRVYGEERLPRLLQGWRTEVESYWIKDDENRWVATDRSAALAELPNASAASPLENYYGLGCFVLRTSD